jgi:dTDP-glucose 4,6-dehydratase
VLQSGRLRQVYHLSPGRGIAVRDVVRTICASLGRPFEEATEVVDERPGQDAAYLIDSTRARTELGWRPVITFAEGIAEVVTWVDEYWTEILQQSLDYQHKV